MLETVRIALGRPARPSKHYECRQCGTAVGEAEADCPSCDSSDVAVFDL